LTSYIIFGASGGIGQIITGSLIKNGHDVTVSSRNKTLLLKLKKNGIALNLAAADVTDEKRVRSAFASHRKHFGSYPDVVVNCAAIQGPIGNAWELDTRDFRKTVDVNLVGSFIVTKTAVNVFKKKGRGVIIHFSGGGSSYSRPRFSPYAAAKTGLLRFVETVSDELKEYGYKNISINAVAPGAVSSRMTRQVIKAGNKAGSKALNEAKDVLITGGTSAGQILSLIEFLSSNTRISGRLIHIRENYSELAKSAALRNFADAGKLRRLPLIAERKK
jgi:NAD(P)-dependent dehydrogenase (short-subunit alcohol dehydrogenase family)